MNRLNRKEKDYLKKIIDMNDFNLNAVSEESLKLCIDDSYKYIFRSFEAHSNHYLNEIYLIIEKYDFMVIFLAYKEFVTKKYHQSYYYNHRELELFISLTSAKSKRKIFKDFKHLLNDIPSSLEIERLELLLRKVNAVFFLGEDKKAENFTENRLYNIFKSPEIMARFKTNYIRGEGSGKQYLDYIEEILLLFDKKNIRKGKYQMHNTIDGFVKLINFPTEHKKNLIKRNGFFRLLVISLLSFFRFDRFTFLDNIRLFFKMRHGFFEIMIETYWSTFYDNEEIIKIFGDESDSFIDLISIELEENFDTNNIWLDNPLWERPLIKFEEGKYLYPIPSLPLSFVEQIITKSLNEIEKEEYYSVKTSIFLERKILSLLKKYEKFTVYDGLKYDYKSRRYETDILIIYKNIAIIVEAKGQNLNKKGRMGNSKRLDNRINKIITDSNEQAERLKKIIYEKKEMNPFFYQGKNIIINFEKIEEVITLSVSFEWLIFFSMSMHQLHEKYNISPGHIHCSLVELEDIIDILETENQFAMYFYKRKLLEESRIPLKCDELDLITHFVENSFLFEPNEFGFNDITGKYDKSSNANYFVNKHSLNLNKDDKINQHIFINAKKQVFKYTDFISMHIEYIKENLNDMFNLIGFFECLPYKAQMFIEETFLKSVKESDSSSKILLNTFNIDQYSPKLIMILNADKIDEVMHYLNKNKIAGYNKRLGDIIVFYKKNKNKIQIDSILYIKE